MSRAARRRRPVLTWIPERRTLVALLFGAALLLMLLVNVAFVAVVAAYHLLVAGVLLRDARRLPGRSSFAVERRIPEPFSLGATETVTVTITSPQAAGMPAEVADHAPLDLAPSPRVVAGEFDADGRLVVDYQTRAPRRGAYRFGAVDLRVRRPRTLLEGWWTRQLRLVCDQEAAVHPDVLAVKRYELLLRRGVSAITGLRRTRPPGATTSVAALRDWLPGDDIRRVSWKATARRDRPVAMEVEAEKGQQMIIMLDCGRLMTAPAGGLSKLDHAVNAALLLAWVGQSQGDRVGLMAFSDGLRAWVPPRAGRDQVGRINDVLYRVRAEYTEPDFAEAFAALGKRVGRRSLVVVLTDVLDPEASRELVASALRLARRHLVLVVAMADPAVLEAREAPVKSVSRAYEWAAAEELLAARREGFEVLHRGGAAGLDVTAGRLSPALVERYLEMKERALL